MTTGICILIVWLLHAGIIYWVIEKNIRKNFSNDKTNIIYLHVIPAKSILTLSAEKIPSQNANLPIKNPSNKILESKIITENSTQILSSPRSASESISVTKEESTLIISDLLAMARKNEHERVKTGIDKLHEDQIILKGKKSETARAISGAAREDCAKAQDTKEFNLLKIIPLALATARDSGCKW